MTYKKLLKKVAKEYGTTPEEVDREMREAIKAAGLNISPQAFIALCSTKAKKTINRNQYNISSIPF